MDLKYGKHLDINNLKDKTFDLFLLAGNHEKRVFTAYNKLNEISIINKCIIFCYKRFRSVHKNAEKKIVKNHKEIYEILDNELLKLKNKEINVFVDYSCMTKSWYYSMILYMSNRDLPIKKVNFYFSYTPSVYSKPQNPKPNFDIGPLPGKYFLPTDKPKALIVCLGYEQNKAEGIIEHLDPKVSYIFYTKPASDARFEKILEKNNETILLEKKGHIFTFPFDDLLFLERELLALYFSLKDDYSVIIAPLGPKPFTLISMLMSVKYNDIDIWRVGSGSDINEYPRVPLSNKFLISEVVWTTE